MKLTYIFFISLFVVACQLEVTKSKKKKGCQHFLADFAAFDANFTQCALMNGVPVEMCQACFRQYKGLELHYSNIQQNQTCKELCFDQDRLNIVEKLYLNSKSLWDNAYCSECFSGDTISNETINIFSLLTAFETCYQQNKDLPCEECRDNYKDVNNMYLNIEKKHSGKVCFDIQDKMNRTRLLWSKTLKCCRRSANLNNFAVISSVLSTLPILFYGAFIFYVKRRENNHEILTIDPENENQHTSPRETCDNSSNHEDGHSREPQPSTSTAALFKSIVRAPKNVVKKIKENESDDSEDDIESDDHYSELKSGSPQSTSQPLIDLGSTSSGIETQKVFIFKKDKKTQDRIDK